MLLFLSTLMILGLVYQFNDAFRQYLDAWFKSDDSGYLFCLIENGYIPGESEVCQLPTFNLKNGKALSSSGIGGEGNSRSGFGKNGAGGSVGGVGIPSLAGDVRGGHSLAPAGNLYGKNGNGAGGGQDGKKGSSTGSTGDLGFSSGFNPFNSNGSNASLTENGRRRYVPYDNKDSTGGTVKGKETIPVTERDLRPARLVAAEKAKKRQLEQDSMNEQFTLGKLTKYLIIFVIFFSIFFFVGSQIFAISQGKKRRR